MENYFAIGLYEGGIVTPHLNNSTAHPIHDTVLRKNTTFHVIVFTLQNILLFLFLRTT